MSRIEAIDRRIAQLVRGLRLHRRGHLFESSCVHLLKPALIAGFVVLPWSLPHSADIQANLIMMFEVFQKALSRIWINLSVAFFLSWSSKMRT